MRMMSTWKGWFISQHNVFYTILERLLSRWTSPVHSPWTVLNLTEWRFKIKDSRHGPRSPVLSQEWQWTIDQSAIKRLWTNALVKT